MINKRPIESFFTVDRYRRSPFRALVLSSLMIATSLLVQFVCAEQTILHIFKAIGLIGAIFFVYTCLGLFLIYLRNQKK